MAVIRVDEVTLDVVELRHAPEIGKRRGVIEQKLVRHHIGRSLLGRREVDVGLEIAAGEFPFELDAFIIAFRVIEGAQDQRLAEISVVDEIIRDLVIGVEPDLESTAVVRPHGRLGEHQRCQRAASHWNLLGHAGIEIMRPLRLHRIV